MGRANRAQSGEELIPEIPLDELKKLDPQDRISLMEAHNYARANQNARPIVEPGQGQPAQPASETPEGE